MSRCARRLLPQTTRRALSTSRPACTPVTDAAPTQAKKWTPALEAGQLAAYDESLKFLKADQKAKEAELEKLRGRADAADKIEELEINALVNDPETRWNFTHGQGYYNLPLGLGLR